MHSPGTVLQLLPSSWWGMQPGAPTGRAGGGTMGCIDSTASPTSADLQMSSLMDCDQANTLYGSVHSSLRETRHYFFVLSLFLAKFRCCIHMPLAGFFWCCGIWEEDIQLLVLRSAEVWTLNKGPPITGRAGVQSWHWHVPTPPVLRVKRIYCFPVLSLFVMAATEWATHSHEVSQLFWRSMGAILLTSEQGFPYVESRTYLWTAPRAI